MRDHAHQGRFAPHLGHLSPLRKYLEANVAALDRADRAGWTANPRSPKLSKVMPGALDLTASHVLSQAMLGVGCTLLFSTAPHGASAACPRPSPATLLTLDCHVSGGGYAIKDVSGRTLENGDGAPFSPLPHAVLHVTASPLLIQVTEGMLPHPDCSSGPVLASFAPIRFAWCQARYEVTPEEAGKYLLRSTSTSAVTDGPHRGDFMEAFIVGACTSANAPRAR